MQREEPAMSDTTASPGFWVVADDPRLNEIVDSVVSGTGTVVRALSALPEPIERDPPVHPDWLLADLGSKGVAADSLERFKTRHPGCQLFLVADHPNAPVPVALARLGVRNWFLRPLDGDALRRVFRAALRSRRAEMERMRRRSSELPSFAHLVGRAPAFREACDLALRAARSPSTVVLIEGETGTGKGVFAKAIHRESPRADGPFVEVNCASLPGQLLESELFGHERGAFTHAQSAKPGLLELADSGTFFLDEVGETAPPVQAKILKFLDSGRYRRLGGIEEREADVRILAATQKDLEAESLAGGFRADLFHRLHVIRIRIPSIRQRPGDARLLLRHYLDIFARRQGRPGLEWSEEALERLETRSWPGNVREIVNLCERLVLMARDERTIGIDDIPDLPSAEPALRARVRESVLRVEIPDGVRFDDLERAILDSALERHGGNVSRAAQSLGMGRGQFRYRMARLGMEDAQPVRRRMRRRKAV